MIIEPANTHAIVVGIEEYDIGPDWNLDGPALDAARFIRYLRDQHIPPGNITLFTKPLAKNRGEIAALDVPARAADSKTFVDTLREKFVSRQGGLLLLLWGGHGVLAGDVRRLFFADVAENLLRNCNFSDLLRSFRTFTGFSRQGLFVDSCADYYELMQPSVGLADVALPTGLPNPQVSQFVLFGAGVGEQAADIRGLRTGAFSSSLIDELKRSPAGWPPDLSAVRSRLEARMLQLRVEGRARQTPVSYSYTDWDGNQGTFRDSTGVSPAATPPQQRSRQLRTDRLTQPERDELARAMLACSVMKTVAERDMIVSDLRPDIANTIARKGNAHQDVLAIVKRSDEFDGGVAELIHVIRGYEGDSLAARELTALRIIGE